MSRRVDGATREVVSRSGDTKSSVGLPWQNSQYFELAENARLTAAQEAETREADLAELVGALQEADARLRYAQAADFVES